jgi:UDP-N-acetylglucosamine 1-carboxyvinyltransferase
MQNACLVVKESRPLHGTSTLVGAKNAALVMMASLILTRGKSILYNVPFSSDIRHMAQLLQNLGAELFYDMDMQTLYVDTTEIKHYHVEYNMMKKMRASVLVMGPLLARFGKASIALPGGCVIGERPINYHLQSFAKMGAQITQVDETISATIKKAQSADIILEYPSVGATENILMLAAQTKGVTRIVNASLEPEVLDFIVLLKKMGANIAIVPPATIEIEGVEILSPVEHTVINDRLEAGALLLAAAVTGGSISLPNAPAETLELFLYKLEEMGHSVVVGQHNVGITLHATKEPRAVSFKTGPHPSFPTDLQAPMMVAQVVADGECVIEETVFENRLLHVRELQKMGAHITVEHNKAIVKGIERLYGGAVIATDIRASCALVLAGLIAQGKTVITGIQHWQRGYHALEQKLKQLGADIEIIDERSVVMQGEKWESERLLF